MPFKGSDVKLNTIKTVWVLFLWMNKWSNQQHYSTIILIRCVHFYWKRVCSQIIFISKRSLKMCSINDGCLYYWIIFFPNKSRIIICINNWALRMCSIIDCCLCYWIIKSLYSNNSIIIDYHCYYKKKASQCL